MPTEETVYHDYSSGLDQEEGRTPGSIMEQMAVLEVPIQTPGLSMRHMGRLTS